MSTKIEWAAQLRKAGIDLPENWAKLSTSRAQAFTEKALGTPPKKGTMARAATFVGAVIGTLAGAAVSGAKAVAEAVTPEPVEAPAPVRKSRPEGYVRKTVENPKWARTTGGGRGWFPSYPAADPDPITRQVRRQNERRAGKMPIGARQSVWHGLKGFGKIGPGRRTA